MRNTPGVRPFKYTMKGIGGELPAYLVLVTNHRSGGESNPWEDIVDHPNGRVTYWGDAKYNQNKKGWKDWEGNEVLWTIYEELLEQRRTNIPPILHFSKPESGQVVFNGLCVIRRIDVTWFEDHGRPVKNLRVHLSILDEEHVDTEWLHSRATAKTTDGANADSPDSWKRYLQNREKTLDLWTTRIRSTESQLPKPGSPDAAILASFMELTPFEFESAVVDLFRQVDDARHHIDGTRPTADGGFDFHGHLVVSMPLAYEIRLKGEVKRYARKTGVGPGDVSRLVARLGRGEFGVFVTTSYYTAQAQREVLDDKYPVKLVSGADLVAWARSLGLTGPSGLSAKWMQAIRDDVAERVIQRW
jgi:hypothetical protein